MLRIQDWSPRQYRLTLGIYGLLAIGCVTSSIPYRAGIACMPKVEAKHEL